MKMFFFHFKSTLCSQDIDHALLSKFRTSQPSSQTITIHMSPNISRRKGNQTMKFIQLTEYNKINIFLQKSCRK